MNNSTTSINTHLKSVSHAMLKMNTLTVPCSDDCIFPVSQRLWLFSLHCILNWPPRILDGVQIGAAAQPFQNIDVMFLEPFPSELRPMRWSIILLEPPTVWKIGGKTQ